ncbi:MAG: glycosyltransferase [Roseivirga sp.]|uniref:glycosyltransferase n=1 Tax=Roseivirga sp. TaxID=1964215 RepID=UPI001B0FC56F|nr:glycosyltransferase [Roseivirga sp.]MBO6494010.1 glycosyltransferase [Roseivirga sp.]
MLTISVVLYNTPSNYIIELITSIKQITLPFRCYIFDNSDSPEAKFLIPTSPEFIYCFQNSNLGFSKTHNLLLNKDLSKSKYTLVLNPDVYFDSGMIEKIIDFMERHDDVGLLLPRVLNPDGTEQPLFKLLPRPKDLIVRRFVPNLLKFLFKKELSDYSMSWANVHKIFEAPYLSGCFMFMRTSLFKQLEGFDSSFFLYCEDIDLSRRISSRSKTIYFSKAYIYHHFNKASYTKVKYLYLHLTSAIKYFNKYGWLYDKQRDTLNQRCKENYSQAFYD